MQNGAKKSSSLFKIQRGYHEQFRSFHISSSSNYFGSAYIYKSVVDEQSIDFYSSRISTYIANGIWNWMFARDRKEPETLNCLSLHRLAYPHHSARCICGFCERLWDVSVKLLFKSHKNKLLWILNFRIYMKAWRVIKIKRDYIFLLSCTLNNMKLAHVTTKFIIQKVC